MSATILSTGERIIRFNAKVQAVHIYIYVIEFYSVEMFSVQIYVETTKKNVELWKPTHQSFWFADLRFRVSTCRNCYANAADDMKKIWSQKEIQNSSSDYEVTFSRNSFYMWVPIKFLNTAICTWITNLFIVDEDIYCQFMIFCTIVPRYDKFLSLQSTP